MGRRKSEQRTSLRVAAARRPRGRGNDFDRRLSERTLGYDSFGNITSLPVGCVRGTTLYVERLELLDHASHHLEAALPEGAVGDFDPHFAQHDLGSLGAALR